MPSRSPESVENGLETETTKNEIEEIEADIVHYQTKRIIFYIYDRVKLITDKVNFENHFNCSWNGTEICVIVQQPVMM